MSARALPAARLAFAFLVFLLPALPCSATLVLKMEPAEIDGRADRVFVGTCISVRAARIENGSPGAGLEISEYVFIVDELIKDGSGTLTETAPLRFRQFGLPSSEGPAFRIPGLPEYREGRRYRLSLHSDSAIGLTSPVGLGQGVRDLGAAEEQR